MCTLLGLILVLGLALVLPRHLPAWLSAQAQAWLESQGFTPAAITVESLDLSGITVTDLELGQFGAHLTLDRLEVGASLESFQKRELDFIALDGAQLTLDLPELLTAIREMPAGESDTPTPESLPLPLARFSLDNSAITLLADDWKRTLETSARLDRLHPGYFGLELGLHDGGESLQVEGFLQSEPIALETTLAWNTLDPWSWLGLLEALNLPGLPAGIALSGGPLRLEGAARASAQEGLERWVIMSALSEPGVSHGAVSLRAGLIHGGASGLAWQPDKLWLGLLDARLHHSDTRSTLTWESLSLESAGPDRLDLHLSPWELRGDFSSYDLGELSLRSAEIHARVRGPWTELRGTENLPDFTLHLRSPASDFNLNTAKGSLSGILGWEAKLSELIWPESVPGENATQPDGKLRLTASIQYPWIQAGAFPFSADRMELETETRLSGQGWASLSVDNGYATWANGAGNLTGIRGTLRLDSLLPPTLPGVQRLDFEQLSQGKVIIHQGHITIEIHPAKAEQPDRLEVQLGGAFAGGILQARVLVSNETPVRAEASLHLRDVSLEQLASLFPEFQGRIDGRVSGEIPIRLRGTQLTLLPGHLVMTGDQPGRFQFTRQGWLTQDASLNPETYVKGRDLLTLMREPNGAAILTEFAMRDLTMTAFRLDILPENQGNRRVTIRIEGNSSIRDVTIPIIQDVRIGDDVKEALNLLLRLQDRVSF